MTDDLVQRLREAAYLDLYGVHCGVEREAAARIKELEDALQRIAKANNSRDRYSPVIDAIVIWALKRYVE